MANRAADVFVQIAGSNVRAGRVWAHRRGAESATFVYDPIYLAHREAYPLDPLLPLSDGQIQTPLGRPTFGAFSDCAPDRWGRRLIERNDRRRTERAGGAERGLGEMDFLLGVRDDLRQGALRFADPETGVFLADERAGVPHLFELPRLLAAAEHLERGTDTIDEIRDLLVGGSSLGGARPKAHVIAPDGRIAIAKFPSPSDDWEVMRWESVALELARTSGITVPDWQLHALDGKAVLLVVRFDRRGPVRIGYISAMTMLEAADHEQASYLDLVEAIEEHSGSPTEDMHELWRRIAFSILISNTDDHLRNHGFLRSTSSGWSLSPAFDINPDPAPGPKRLTTAIAADDAAEIEALVNVAERFRLSVPEARMILSDVSRATTTWRDVAASNGLDQAAIAEMAPAFEHAQAERARDAATA